MTWFGKYPIYQPKHFSPKCLLMIQVILVKKRYYRLGGNTSDTSNQLHKDMAKIWISGFNGSLTDCISPQPGKHNIFSNSLPLYPL